MTDWSDVLRALWLFLPAYVANMSPVLMAKAIPGWNAPIDGGRLHKDGRRVLGAGKTWRGLVGGAVLGGVTAVVLAYAAPPQGQPGLFAGYDFGFHGHTYQGPLHDGHQVPGSCPQDAFCDTLTWHAQPSAGWAVFLFGAIVGAMALVGDAVKSYFKRRRGKEGGAPWVPFDQLDFVVFGLAAMLLASPLLAHDWVFWALGNWMILATLLVLTPVLHLAVNGLGFLLGLKKVPW